jgi:16S rRNA processing protein RimM
LSAATAPETIVVMAQVLAPYGVQGWVKARPYTQAPDALLQFDRWWLRNAGMQDWREVHPLATRMHSGAVLAQFEGVASREAAHALSGAQIGVRRSDFAAPKRGEIYVADLVGLAVVNREGVQLGEVVAVEEYGAHPLLRVAPAEANSAGQRLIPFVEAHVDRVDLDERRIEVDWQTDY